MNKKENAMEFIEETKPMDGYYRCFSCRVTFKPTESRKREINLSGEILCKLCKKEISE